MQITLLFLFKQLQTSQTEILYSHTKFAAIITFSYMHLINSSSNESWTVFAQTTLHVSCHMTHQVLCDDSDLILRRTARLLLILTSCLLHLLVMPSGNTAGLWPTWNNSMKSSKKIL